LTRCGRQPLSIVEDAPRPAGDWWAAYRLGHHHPGRCGCHHLYNQGVGSIGRTEAVTGANAPCRGVRFAFSITDEWFLRDY